MKFVCDRCQTRYTIADEKIRRRIVRIRCKNCGGVITLHAGEVVAGTQDSSPRLSDDLPAVPSDSARASSRVSRPPTARSEWFVAVDGTEKGPMSCAEAAQYIVALGPERAVHVWKEGVDEWKRPKDVAILAQELSSLKRSPAEPPAGARGTMSSDATVVTPAPVAFDLLSRPAPPAAPGSAPKLPGMGAKASPAGKGAALPSLSSASKPGSAISKPVSSASASAPEHAPQPGHGAGPKAAPPKVSGSGPKTAPPPIPTSHRAPPPIPGSVPRTTPVAPASAVADVRPAAKSATYPVVKTPPPATASQRAAVSAVAEARPAAKSATHPVVKTPPPATASQRAAVSAVAEARPAAKSATYSVAKTPSPATSVAKTPSPATASAPVPMAAVSAVADVPSAVKPSAEPVVKTPPPATVPQTAPKTTSAAVENTPGAKSEFDDEVPTAPDVRRKAPRVAKEARGPESTPPLENTPGVQDFLELNKTPPPSQPLAPVGTVAHPVRESRSWEVPNLSFAHPPAMPEGMSAEGAMALPTPAPLTGPLFAHVADMPVKSLVGHAEVGLSKLTGLAALVHKHRYLKYVTAAGLLVVLVIAVILLSWRGEDGSSVSKVAEIEKKARAAALAADPIPVPPEEPAVLPDDPAVVPTTPEREQGRLRAAHASKRVVSHPVAPSGKPAPAENPLEPPAGMMRSAEKPIPLAALQGRRASAASEPRAISQAQISEVVRRKENQAALKTCYERALKRDGRLRTGRLDITVSIGPMGTVQRVQVHGSADFMVIDGCLKEAIRHWRFPANSEEYATSFPLILQGG